MASTRIREAKERDCGDILRMIRVKTVGWKMGCRGAGSSVVGGGELDVGGGEAYLWTLLSKWQGLPALLPL